ncbi:MAG: sulfatase-like hydrolase/transferase [Simkaniaceae bacterium]|nr:sulfatase-like hydrolase/transferase [Simkaniaceae bacterium]
MDSFINLLILFTFPSFAVRVLILQHKELFSKPSTPFLSVMGAFIVGVCQDLFVTIQVLILFGMLSKIVPFAFMLQLVAFALIQLNIIFDAYLYRKTSIRMDVAFFAFINDIKCFWDSAKAKGIGLFLPSACLFLLYPLMLFPFVKSELIDFSLKAFDMKLCIGISLVAIFGRIPLSKRLLYAIDNAVFHQEIWVVKQVFSFINSKRLKLSKSAKMPKNVFLPMAEVSSAVSSEFPLLKFTEKFEGEKQCEVDIKSKELPNIIFLFMESFRAKDIGALGGSFDVSPNFDRLAKEGILFSNFYANSIKTSRSLTSSLFGIPSDIDTRDGSSDSSFPLISIADILANAGYQTAYLHNGEIAFENQFDFLSSHGFETVYGKDDILKHFPNAPSSSWGLPDEYLMQYATKWLKEQKSPTFLTMFTMTNHHPWIIPDDYNPPKFPSHLKPNHRKYLETFHYSDQALGKFASTLDDQTILFVLGDHGQAMGEHMQNFTQQKGLYEENIHVPLLIYAKDRIKIPKIIPDISSQLDLIPTVMDMLGIQAVNHSIGSSLLRKVNKRKIFFHNPFVYGFFGMREGPLKFIYSKSIDEVELYDLEKDPDEKNNIAKERPDQVEKFLAEIKVYKRFFKEIYDNKRFVPNKFETS